MLDLFSSIDQSSEVPNRGREGPADDLVGGSVYECLQTRGEEHGQRTPPRHERVEQNHESRRPLRQQPLAYIRRLGKNSIDRSKEV